MGFSFLKGAALGPGVVIAMCKNSTIHKKIPQLIELRDFGFRSLAMTYSHMGIPHTTIGDASFHF